MNSWCESCARKNQCYPVDIRPKCFVPITSNDRTIERKTEPQTHTLDLGNGFSITANDCTTCKHQDKSFDELPCDMCCKANSGYEPKTEPQMKRNE